MNKEQKAAAVAEIAEQIEGSDAVFAIDYRGITVAQVGELRTKLRDADTTFRVVKNTLTERAADNAGAEDLKAHLEGPTALAFVRGDAAAAAKAIADFQKATGGELLPFKGGLMNGAALDSAQIVAISKLPSRDVLYGQLVGMIASPITGLARGMNGLLSGLAVALGGVLEGKQDGSIPAGEAADAAPAEPLTDEGSADAEPSATAEEAEPEAAASADAEAVEESADADSSETETNNEGSEESEESTDNEE
ncbi:MAG: 50S ribosomal protein L10 [Baekduia sp.]